MTAGIGTEGVDGSPRWDPGRGLEVGVGDVAAARREGWRFRLIDCREEDEWAICRLEGAELLPLGSFPERARELLDDPGEVIIIYCHHGMRSAAAAEFLRTRGHAWAFSMAGGINRWSREVDPAVPVY